MSPPVPSEQVPSADATSRPLAAVISPGHPRPPVPGPVAGEPSWADLFRHARCADASLDPDQWFPVSAEAGKARREAAAAIAVCSSRLVRPGCLALSLRHWDVGQHGVWGGMVPAERAQLRRRVFADHDGGDRALRDVMTAASGGVIMGWAAAAGNPLNGSAAAKGHLRIYPADMTFPALLTFARPRGSGNVS